MHKVATVAELREIAEGWRDEAIKWRSLALTAVLALGVSIGLRIGGIL